MNGRWLAVVLRVGLAIVTLGLTFAAALGCSRGGASDSTTAVQPTPSETETPSPTATTPPLVRPIATPPSTTPGTNGTAVAAAPTGPAGPPGPSPTPFVRNANGLQIIDEVWIGRVKEAGGLRVRSSPRVEPNNVVGSLPQGWEVTVEARILNGQEAEPGKGTVWLLVGVNQYVYNGTGYIERIR